MLILPGLCAIDLADEMGAAAGVTPKIGANTVHSPSTTLALDQTVWYTHRYEVA